MHLTVTLMVLIHSIATVSMMKNSLNLFENTLRETNEIAMNNNYYVLNLVDCFSQGLYLSFLSDSLHESFSSIQLLTEI